ncbi:MAG: alpha/beta fold hydrolase [Reinekea sp.]|jgi:esterase
MLHTESFGQGPDVVFLHGLFGAGDNWRSIGRQLSEHYRVHLIDLPNHGRSDWIDTQDLQTLANIVGDWINNQGIKQFHLLGHSMGGKIAMQLALNPHQGELLQLIVVDISPKRYPPHHQDIFKALNRVDFNRLKDRNAIDDDMKDLVTNDTVRQFLLKSLYRNGDQLAWRFNLKILENRYDAVAAEPTATAPFTGPALFIKGKNSHYISADDQPLIASLFPNAKAKIIEGAGHWPHAEKPAVFSKIVKDFLDQGI